MLCSFFVNQLKVTALVEIIATVQAKMEIQFSFSIVGLCSERISSIRPRRFWVQLLILS